MGYFPPLAGATPKSRYLFGDYEAILFVDIPPAGPVIGYNYVLAVFPQGSSEPIFCVASEYSKGIPSGVAVLGTFDGTGHTNLGTSTEWTQQERFCETALDLAKKHLQLPQETTLQQGEAAYSGSQQVEGKPVRKPEEILKQSGIPQGEFFLLYQSYRFSLSLSGQTRDWNEGIEDHARNIGALRESEVVLAKTDLNQAIINRIIVRLVTAGRMKGQAEEEILNSQVSEPKNMKNLSTGMVGQGQAQDPGGANSWPFNRVILLPLMFGAALAAVVGVNHVLHLVFGTSSKNRLTGRITHYNWEEFLPTVGWGFLVGLIIGFGFLLWMYWNSRRQ